MNVRTEGTNPIDRAGGGFGFGPSLLLGRSSASELVLERRGANCTSLSTSRRRRFWTRRVSASEYDLRGISPFPEFEYLLSSP